MGLPKFIGIGGHRCGTTFFFNCLTKHPQIETPHHMKEPCFFNYQYHKGVKWYKTLFKNNSVCGEATTGYLYYPLVPYLMKKDLPDDIVLYCIVRNPIDRAYSHWWRNKQIPGVEDKNFYNAMKLETRRITRSATFEQRDYLTRGLYADFLRNWLDLYPNIIIIKFEDMIKHTTKYLNKVFDALGLDHYPVNPLSVEKWMKNHKKEETRRRIYNKYPPLKKERREELRQLYKIPNKKLKDLCGVSW